MQNFRTVVKPTKSPFLISHSDKIVSIGSCFSENIGRKFRDYKFDININPFGQQYNPASISTAIHRILEAKPYTIDELVYHDELYHSYDHHGSFSRATSAETLALINQNLQQASLDLKQASILFLTFGTSHVFSLKEENTSQPKIVSNCHKLSGNLFNKRLMQPAEIVSSLQVSLTHLFQLNPTIEIVLTVSPVRYFAFGHHENTVSKAHLFSAIYQLQQQFTELYYFPAYEIVMDDLRDYRFFSEDMLHPNYQATAYVWQQLCQAMLDKKTITLMEEMEEILLAARHRARNPNSEAHKKFIAKNLEKINQLALQVGVSFNEEIELLKKQQNL